MSAAMNPDLKNVTIKTVPYQGLPFPSDYKVHIARWYWYDGINAPQVHCVTSAAFKDHGEEVLREFSHHLHAKLLQFPPCDPERVRAERAKAKSL